MWTSIRDELGAGVRDAVGDVRGRMSEVSDVLFRCGRKDVVSQRLVGLRENM